MIVAPKVAGPQLARFFIGLWHLPSRLFNLVFRRRIRAVTPEGEVVEVVEETPVLPPAKPANDEDGSRQAAE